MIIICRLFFIFYCLYLLISAAHNGLIVSVELHSITFTLSAPTVLKFNGVTTCSPGSVNVTGINSVLVKISLLYAAKMTEKVPAYGDITCA